VCDCINRFGLDALVNMAAATALDIEMRVLAAARTGLHSATRLTKRHRHRIGLLPHAAHRSRPYCDTLARYLYH